MMIESLHSPNCHQDSVAWEGRGQYSAHLFGMRAEALIRQNMFEVTPAMVQRLFFDIITQRDHKYATPPP